MVLNGLQPLAVAMGHSGVQRRVFPFDLLGPNPLQMSVAFVNDEVPWVLVFGVVGHNIAFEIPVRAGYRVNPSDIPKDTWLKILKLLGVKYNADDPFTREKFLTQVDAEIPNTAPHRNPFPHEMPRRVSVTEEADKVYFVRWLPHTGGKNVTPANLEKTAKYLGTQWADMCRRRNISSCWSATTRDFNVPPPP